MMAELGKPIPKRPHLSKLKLKWLGFCCCSSGGWLAEGSPLLNPYRLDMNILSYSTCEMKQTAEVCQKLIPVNNKLSTQSICIEVYRGVIVTKFGHNSNE